MTEVTLVPREVSVLITGRCNLSCGHCGVRQSGVDLPLGTWERILDRLVEARVLELVISGGEPLCRPDFRDFLGLVLERPFRFSLNTNAVEMTAENAAALAKAGQRLTSVMAGLDGPDAPTHDALRGTGVFAGAVLGIRTALGAGLPVITNCTVTRLNWNRTRETADFALSDLGVPGAKFTPMLAAQCEIPAGLHASTAMLLSAARDLAALKETGAPVYGPLLSMLEMAEKAAKGLLRQEKGRAFGCGGCVSKLVVAADGGVIPCDYIDGFVLGRLPDRPLNEIVRSGAAREFMNIVAAPRALNPECAECQYLSVCTGGCPVTPLLTGELPGKDDLSCVKMLVEALASLPFRMSI